MKVAELEGVLLDAAVAKAEGRHYQAPSEYTPSSQWAWGGPLIERERITISPPDEDGPFWLASMAPSDKGDWWNVGATTPEGKLLVGDGYGEGSGETPLIAAMRAYVASKFGQEVELP